jgi:anti-anti-sigma factor
MHSPLMESQMSSTTHPPPQTAQFATRWAAPSAVVITAQGEIDAANAQELVDYALRHGDRIESLVLDMTDVEFFGTSGFSALHTLNVRCAGQSISWASVPSPVVTRLLGICDPDSTLPFYSGVDSALSALGGHSGRLLELVPETG